MIFGKATDVIMKSGYVLLGMILVIGIAIVAVMVMVPSPRKIQTPLTSTTTINQSELMATGPCTPEETDTHLLVCKAGQNFTELKLLKVGLDAAQVIIYDRCPISNQSNTSKCSPEIEWVLVNQTIQNCASGSAALESGLVSTNMNAQTAVFAIPPANTTVSPCILIG